MIILLCHLLYSKEVFRVTHYSVIIISRDFNFTNVGVDTTQLLLFHYDYASCTYVAMYVIKTRNVFSESKNSGSSIIIIRMKYEICITKHYL